MTEKRFILAEDSNGLYSIFDTEDKEDEPLIYGARFGTEKIVGLLNEQQATIKRLEEENDDLRFALRTEQAFTRVEKDKKPFLSKEEFLKELEDE